MADISNRIVRMENLWQYMNEVMAKQIRNKDNLDRFFQNGVTTMADYGNNRKYRITGYDLQLTPMSKFPCKKFKNYLEYFVQTYKKNQNSIIKNQFLVTAEVNCKPFK